MLWPTAVLCKKNWSEKTQRPYWVITTRVVTLSWPPVSSLLINVSTYLCSGVHLSALISPDEWTRVRPALIKTPTEKTRSCRNMKRMNWTKKLKKRFSMSLTPNKNEHWPIKWMKNVRISVDCQYNVLH